jgi:hypothetical protein
VCGGASVTVARADSKCFAKLTVQLKLADEKSGVDCVRNFAKISVVPT